MTKHGLGHEDTGTGSGGGDEREGTGRQSQVTVEMRALHQLVLFTTLFSSNKAYFLHDYDGYSDLRYDFHGGPAPPTPLEEPPPRHYPFLPQPSPLHPPFFHEESPLVYRAPPQTVFLHVPVRARFPPFIERIVQRIQTFWSVYNPPELLTRPPPEYVPTTTRRPTKKITTTTTAPTSESPSSTSTSDVTSPSEDSTTKVSTLAVYEVTPSSPVVQDSTTEPSSPEGDEADTEEPLFITPERASALGQKEAFLRFLKTGKVPPFLQPDSYNEMDTEEDTAT